MDQWIIAGCAILGMIGSFIIQSSKAGGRDRQIVEHERRIGTLEVTTGDHGREIYLLRGEHNTFHKID